MRPGGNDVMTAEEAKRWATAPALDYKAIGFRCGLEIHQQLATGKLFSRVPGEVLDPEEVAARTVGEVTRTLRATGSEAGAVDAAAQAEAGRGRTFRYLALSGLTSLVELDEEPPKPMDDQAFEVALTFSGLVGARPVDEIPVMRKTVIDGSNTSGFQRTALVATGGAIRWPNDEDPQVGIWTIALEEDSARLVGEEKGVATYTLDRLGIPLIEVATAPDIRDPGHAQRTAARIGALLRATGRVKRGLGTIRQDLNVSVAVGQRVEIKGCQDLRAVPRVIEGECRRQLWLHHVAGEIQKRHPAAPANVVDLCATLKASPSKAIAEGLARGHVVLGLCLPGLAGLLKGATKEGPRLGRELADHARVAAGVKGIFHSDELPGYGVTADDVAACRAALGVAPDDAFALVVERETTARRALAAVAARSQAAARGAESEVRTTLPDDSTRYMRPMPGAARMYPETDVPPIPLPRARWASIVAHLPPLPEERVALLAQKVSLDVARQLVAEGEEEAFRELTGTGADPALCARILLQYLPDVKPEVRRHLGAVVAEYGKRSFAKEAIPAILRALSDDSALTVPAAVERAGVQSAGLDRLDEVVRRVVAERRDFVTARRQGAVGPLMGPVMAEMRGKVDGALVAERLKKAIEELL
ncbi:MAG: Glu-tRNA(Gln) amidotransferase subunit GatE [Thermoplasmatota archaeon]